MKKLIEKAHRLLMRRRGRYRDIFRGPNGEAVLRDLAGFCRAADSTFDPDPRIAAALDGRREVWLRIQHHLRLTPDELWRIYDGRQEQEG